MVRDSLPYINIACENNDSTLARNLCDLRGLIFQTIKTSWLEDALAKSNYGVASAASLILFFIIFVITLVNLYVSSKKVHY